MSSHEREEVTDALCDLCEELRIQTLIQVGAGNAYEAHLVQERTGCRSIAFEGNPGLKCPFPGIEYNNIVVGATNCETKFYIYTNDVGLSGHFKRDGRDKASLLPQIRLDTFCNENGIKPDGLIIDTEGTTVEVLEGCGNLIGGLKMVYAECQAKQIHAGGRLVDEANKLLISSGMSIRHGLPAYWDDFKTSQGNYTWVRES